jgi:sugar lactone lactonase YvrE
MKAFLVLSIYLFSFSVLYAQNPEWINYTSVSNAISTVIEGDNVWIGTNGGLVKFNKTTGERTFFNKNNSGLPSNYVTSLAIDSSGNKWIGTYGGLAKFDGTTWTVYTQSNSGLPSDTVNSIAIDNSGNKWIGTYGGGLAKFDGTTWTVYNTSNSGLPFNVASIAIDGSGNKWIGTGGGLAKFDGTTWTVYTTSNSGLPFNYVTSIAIDGSGNKWIGTGGGLAKFDGTTWTVYTTSNSDLPENDVTSIVIDGSGNKWIGTDGGLAVYKEGGVTSVKEIANKNIPESFVLFQNYPNPFNPSTVISYQIASTGKVSLKVYDILGREVATLVNDMKAAGNYTATFNASKLPSGVYFYRLQAGTFTQTKKLVLLK